jgi:DNA-binding IclR family transcriptional regulator
MNSLSGVGVLDKAMAVLAALEPSPRSLAELVTATGLSRATAHRLAVALEVHGLVRRDDEGRFSLGLRLIGLGHAAAEAIPGWLDARPALAWLQSQTGESVQLFVRDGDERVCVESLEAPHELRTIVPVGARLPLDRGSAGHVLRPPAAAPPAAGAQPAAPPAAAAGRRPTARARSSGWVESVAEREPGVASVSAPVADLSGRVIAAVSVSGPIDRTTRSPGRRYGAAVVEAAARISAHLT